MRGNYGFWGASNPHHWPIVYSEMKKKEEKSLLLTLHGNTEANVILSLHQVIVLIVDLKYGLHTMFYFANACKKF